MVKITDNNNVESTLTQSFFRFVLDFHRNLGASNYLLMPNLNFFPLWKFVMDIKSSFLTPPVKSQAAESLRNKSLNKMSCAAKI